VRALRASVSPLPALRVAPGREFPTVTLATFHLRLARCLLPRGNAHK